MRADERRDGSVVLVDGLGLGDAVVVLDEVPLALRSAPAAAEAPPRWLRLARSHDSDSPPRALREGYAESRGGAKGQRVGSDGEIRTALERVHGNGREQRRPYALPWDRQPA
jgi:hypothetical protein